MNSWLEGQTLGQLLFGDHGVERDKTFSWVLSEHLREDILRVNATDSHSFQVMDIFDVISFVCRLESGYKGK